MPANGESRIGFWRAIGLTLATVIRHWRTCLAIAAIYAVPWGIANAVSRSSTRILDPRTLSASQVTEAGIAWVAAIGALLVIGIFLGSLVIGALSLVGSAAVYDDEIDTRGIVRRAIDRGWDAVAAYLLVLLVIGIGPLAAGVVALMFTAVTSASFAFVALVFGVLFVALPSLYVGVRLTLAVPVVMREGRGPVDALRRSWELTAGGWWWIFGIGVALSLVPIVLQQVFEAIVGRGGAADFVAWAAASAVVAAVSAMVFGVAAGVVYACRAPEDVVPPDVARSEARVDQAALPDQ